MSSFLSLKPSTSINRGRRTASALSHETQCWIPPRPPAPQQPSPLSLSVQTLVWADLSGGLPVSAGLPDHQTAHTWGTPGGNCFLLGYIYKGYFSFIPLKIWTKTTPLPFLQFQKCTLIMPQLQASRAEHRRPAFPRTTLRQAQRSKEETNWVRFSNLVCIKTTRGLVQAAWPAPRRLIHLSAGWGPRERVCSPASPADADTANLGPHFENRWLEAWVQLQKEVGSGLTARGVLWNTEESYTALCTSQALCPTPRCAFLSTVFKCKKGRWVESFSNLLTDYWVVKPPSTSRKPTGSAVLASVAGMWEKLCSNTFLQQADNCRAEARDPQRREGGQLRTGPGSSQHVRRRPPPTTSLPGGLSCPFPPLRETLLQAIWSL